MEKKDLKKGMKLRFVTKCENFKMGDIVTFEYFRDDDIDFESDEEYDISILEDDEEYHSFSEFEMAVFNLDYLKTFLSEKQEEKSKIDDEISEIEKKIKYLEDNNLKECDETLFKATDVYKALKNDNLSEKQKIELIANILRK